MEVASSPICHYSFESVDHLFTQASINQQRDIEFLESEKDRNVAFDTIVATHRLFYQAMIAVQSLDKEQLPQLKLEGRIADYSNNLTILYAKVVPLFLDHLGELDKQIQTMMETKIKDNNMLAGDYPRDGILVDCARIALSQQDDWRGFIWEVPTNHTTHSIIATVHVGMPKMLKNIVRVINQSEVFYAECGELSEQDRKKIHESCQSIGYGFGLDAYLIGVLKDAGEEINSLETPEIQKKIVASLPSNLPKDIFKAPFMQGLIYQFVRTWQLGDERQAEALTSTLASPNALIEEAQRTEIIDHRSENWCKEQGLLNLLKTSDKPICLFAGISHFFGEHGLLKIFLDNGLTINRVTEV